MKILVLGEPAMGCIRLNFSDSGHETYVTSRERDNLGKLL
jgi:hypothetical protein